jgi:hypothetical protein
MLLVLQRAVYELERSARLTLASLGAGAKQSRYKMHLLLQQRARMQSFISTSERTLHLQEHTCYTAHKHDQHDRAAAASRIQRCSSEQKESEEEQRCKGYLHRSISIINAIKT